MVKYTDDELLADIRKVADIVGDIPSAQDYRDHGKVDITTIYRRFGSWTDAREAAGIDGTLDYGAPLKIDRRKVLQDIRGLWLWLGRVPTIDDYKRWGRYSQKPFYTQFDGWVDARREAGVFDRSLVTVTKQDLIERLQWLYEKLGREPTIYDYRKHIANNDDIFAKFGGFIELKKAAGVYEGGIGPWRDITVDNVVADIREKNELVDGPITVEEYKRIGGYSEPTVSGLFNGSFVEARGAAGIYDGSLLEATGRLHHNYTGNHYSIYKTESWYNSSP